MKFFIPLIFSILTFAGERNLFTKTELELLNKLKSNKYLLKKYKSELSVKGRAFFDFSLKKDREFLKKKLLTKDPKFFESLERKDLYKSMFKKFLEE
ncbi:MAG: hypothetical protein BM556_12670 [Bacteriovorax sp. MedPE-SWde]|nr:MAG: hypothetical protein BM556_12670 [Bacteriovorax sp. MedPE-SWde]